MPFQRVQTGDDLTPEAINQVYDVVEKVESLTVDVQTLEPEQQATASLNLEESKLNLGLPRGVKGETGTAGLNGKSLEYKGLWSADISYVNNEVKADLVRKDGNVYICKQNNQGAPPPNDIYWDLFVPKGQDGAGSGNLKGTNVSTLTVEKTYAIQATTIPSEGGTLEGVLVEVASVTDVERKLEKNFDAFYTEKASIADDDLIAIQDSADVSTPKSNKKVKLGLLKGFDLIIRTQAQFETLIDSPNWLGAVSVALIGQFTLSTPNNSGVKIPATVKQIQGFNGAKITIMNFEYSATTAKGGLWYDTTPTTNDYSIRDLEVDCTGSDARFMHGYGFSNCANLTNCIGKGTGIGSGTVTGSGTDGYGFYNCTNLTNCTGTGSGTSIGCGFYNCDNLINCTGTGSSGGGKGHWYGYGFYNCTNLTNCAGTGTSTVYGRGFYNCTNLTNCTGSGTGSGYGYGYGFDHCANLTNCTGTGSGSDGYGYGFYSCTNLTNCTGKGTGTGGGYGFYDITTASNCKNGGSSANMWGGTNKNIDINTCRKTPIQITPTELTTLNA